MKLKKYGVVQCPFCGWVQGSQLIGGFFLAKDTVKKNVLCFQCKRKILLSVESILFMGDDSKLTSDWIMNYKKKIALQANEYITQKG